IRRAADGRPRAADLDSRGDPPVARPMTDVAERLSLPPIRLTELTDCGGCAAKLGADLLADALAGRGAAQTPPELIAGLAPADDAAAWRISDDLAVIGTLDFFPPLVDDARTFGE